MQVGPFLINIINDLSVDRCLLLWVLVLQASYGRTWHGGCAAHQVAVFRYFAFFCICSAKSLRRVLGSAGKSLCRLYVCSYRDFWLHVGIAAQSTYQWHADFFPLFLRSLVAVTDAVLTASDNTRKMMLKNKKMMRSRMMMMTMAMTMMVMVMAITVLARTTVCCDSSMEITCIRKCSALKAKP